MSDISGISFPFKFSNLGGVAAVSGEDKIKSNLRALVLSSVNERLIRKQVGSIGYSKVFRNITDIGDEIVETLVGEAIAKFERRIKVKELSLYTIEDSGGVEVHLKITYFRKNGLLLDVADIVLS